MDTKEEGSAVSPPAALFTFELAAQGARRRTGLIFLCASDEPVYLKRSEVRLIRIDIKRVSKLPLYSYIIHTLFINASVC